MLNSSEKLTELLHRQTGIANEPAHREGLDWVVPWQRELPVSVAHNDVLALSDDSKTDLLEAANGVQVVDPR